MSLTSEQPVPAAAPPAHAVPSDVESAVATDGWRDGFRWPVPHSLVDRQLRARGAAMARAIADTEDAFGRNLMVLGGLPLSGYAASLLEAALELPAVESGEAPFDRPSEAHLFLAGRLRESALAPPRLGAGPPIPVVRPLPRLREAKTGVVLRGARGVIDTLDVLRGGVSVIGRSPNLDPMVRDEAGSVRYLDPARLYAAARRLGEPVVPDEAVNRASELVAQIWTAVPQLDDGTRTRMRQLLWREAEPWLAAVAKDLARFGQLRRLPRTLWTPTGAKYLPRLIGLEVLNRGGAAIRHGHGGETAAFRRDNESLVRRELQASSGFVMPTTRFATLLRQSSLGKSYPSIADVQLIGGRGDPDIAGVGRTRPRAGGRLRVCYVPTLYRDRQQYLSAAPRGPVYLDWQLRLLAALKRLPVEVTSKPHPREALAGRSPLAGVCNVDYSPFQDVADAFDVLVFDHLNSTALAMGLCASKRVIYLPVTPTPLLPVLETAFRDRCTVVDVHYDDRNRILVDEAQLAEAVFAQGVPDPGFFRDLIVGDGDHG